MTRKTAKPAKPSKNHHFVPRSTLRRFSIDGARNRVWVLDKRKDRVFSAAIENVGSQNDFNRLVRDDGEAINFEFLFDSIDANFALTGDVLAQHRTLAGASAEFLHHLADGAAVQHLRTPLARSTYQSLPRQISNMLREKGLPPLPDEDLPSDNDARRHSVKMIADRDRMRAALLDKDLVLMAPAGQARFWTSDNPIARMSIAPNGDTGFEAQGVQIHLPIADDLMLGFFSKSYLAMLTNLPLEVMNIDPAKRAGLMRWRQGLRTGQPVLLDDAEVKNLNGQQVANSTRFVYASRNDFDAARRILERHPRLRTVESAVYVGRMGEGPPRSRTVPKGSMLALYGRERHHLIPLIDWDPDDDAHTATTDRPGLLHDVLRDRPFSSAEFYLDRQPLKGMGGGVDIEILEPGPVTRFRVVHADPGLRALDEMLARRKLKGD
jgi:hypothetical protein